LGQKLSYVLALCAPQGFKLSTGQKLSYMLALCAPNNSGPKLNFSSWRTCGAQSASLKS
jgi:hypothetical protein